MLCIWLFRSAHRAYLDEQGKGGFARAVEELDDDVAPQTRCASEMDTRKDCLCLVLMAGQFADTN